MIREDPAPPWPLLRAWLGRASTTLWAWVVAFMAENPAVAAAAAFGAIRAMGVTIQSGTSGLRFTLGRAGRVLEPGFHPLIPFAQRVRVLPTRSRTLDLPGQRVTTRDGLVYLVDASLIYRITDLRRALVQVDDLGRGMRQMLGLCVQEELRQLERDAMRLSPEIDRVLSANMARRLEPWGVTVERGGLSSLTPSPETLRLTQQSRRAGTRQRALESFRAAGLDPWIAVALAARGSVPVPRSRRARESERLARQRARLLGALRISWRSSADPALRRQIGWRMLRELETTPFAPEGAPPAAAGAAAAR